MVTLISSARLNIGRHDATEDQSSEMMQLTESSVAFQVVRNRPAEDFLEVFVPGTGVCWLSRTHVKDVRPQHKRSAHSVRELSLHSPSRGRDSGECTVELLQMVGGPLERLHLDLSGGLADNRFCRSVMTACPSLAYLRIRATKLESLDWLTNATVPCQLTALSLDLSERTESGPSAWWPFFAALSDPTHPLTRSLRELQIDVTQLVHKDSESAAEAEAVALLLSQMLDKNHKLERCELGASVASGVTAEKQHFRAHYGKSISGQKAPPPLPHKLAFLSVVGRVHDADSTSNSPSCYVASKRAKLALGVLTIELIQLVFAFAAIPKQRICLVTGSAAEL